MIAKVMMRGVSSTIVNKSYTTKIEDIFKKDDKSDDSSKVILIEGVAGIGKTILCKEIAYRWACKQIILSDKLVLLVFLRDPAAQNINSVEDLVCYFYKSDSKSIEFSEISNKLVSTEGNNVTIILDGFDEISHVKDETDFFQRLLFKDILPLCRIVVTSRPISSNMTMLQDLATVKVEILGFTKENRQKFIENGLKDNPDKLAKLNSYLKTNSVIDHLCYIPFMLSILVCIAKEYSELPKSQTEVYTKFIIYTISKFLQKCYLLSGTISQINKLPPQFKAHFLDICKYAYNALQCDKIVFTANEIKTDFTSFTDPPGNWSGLGLLKSAQYFCIEENNDRISCNFLHLSIQEYLAAYYISELSTNQQLTILKKYFFDEKYLNMWIMYTGLCEKSLTLRHFLSGKKFYYISKLFRVNKVSNSILQSKIKCLYLFQCLRELKDSNLHDHIGHLFESGRLNLSGHTLLEKDINMLTSILDKSATTHWKKLNLSNCNIGDIGCIQLCKDLQAIDHQLRFDTIDLSSNLLTTASLTTIADILMYCQTKRVHLSNNTHIYNIAAIYLAKICAFRDTLKIFPHTIRIKGEENVVLKSLDQQNIVLQLNPKYWITGVDLINCDISKDVIAAITRINSSLNRLCIWDCHISKNVILHLLLKIMPVENKRKLFFVYAKSSLFDNNVFDIASKNYCLFMFILLDDVSLILHRVNFMHIRYILFSNPKLPKTNKLSKIKLFKCETDNETANLLLELFKQSRMLVQFILVDNNFKLELLKQTISTIKGYSSLREIYISDYILIYDDYCTMADELSCNQMHSIVMFYKNFLRCFRNLDEHLDFEAIGLQPLEGTSQRTPHCVTYVKSQLSGGSDLCTLQSIHICLYKSKLILNKINDYLTTHMIMNSQSLELIYLTEIDLTHCKLKEEKVINLLLQKFITCEQLTSFIYSDNDITVDSTIFTQFMYDLIALPYMRKMYVHELSLKENDINAIQNQLCNYPKLKSVIKNDNMVMCSNCLIKSYDKFIFSMVSGIAGICTLWLQYCEINVVALGNIVHYSQFNEVVIKKSMIYTEEMQLPYWITTSIKSLNLSHNQIAKSALNVLISIILHSSELQELSLINNHIQLEMTRKAGKIVSLQQLHLYKDNMLDVAKDLADVISSKHLQKLFLNEIYLLSTIKVIAKSLKKSSKLKELNLNGIIDKSKVLPSLIPQIIKNNSLQKLYLKDMNLETKGIINIGKNLRDISSLKVLDLQNNFITEEAGEVLASIISSNTKLEALYLGNNHLQAGIIKLFTALKKISSLKMLDLENNKMSKEVATELAAVISGNNSLQRIWLNNNNNLGSSIESVAVACSKISNLEQLCITNIGISNKVGKDIASIINNNLSIIQLSISDNNLQSSGFKFICHELMHIKTLKYFHACRINATATVTKELKMVIDNNTSLEEISLSDNLLETGLIEIMESCRKLTGLKLLELSHNCISPSHVIDLVSTVNKFSSLQSLSLGGITLNIYENLYLSVFKKAYTFKEGNDILFNNKQHTIVEYVCCELLKMITTQDFLLNYDTIHLSYIYEYVHVSYQYEDIFNKIFVNRTECKSIIQEANRKISQIDSKAMITSLLIIKTLKVINLENNNIDEEASQILAGHLQCNNILEQLWLKCNKGASVILKSLHNLSTLLILDLSFNHLGSKSADDIAIAIGNNFLLQQLWLDGNDLMTSGVVIIARALKTLSSLRILSLCSNEITDDAAEEISNVITSNVLLVDLLLGNNQLKTTGVNKIAVALSKVLTLRKLDLFNNHITPDVGEDLAATLSSCTNLQQLFLSNNMLGTEGTIKIAYALKHINSLQVLTLSNNNITKFAADVLVDVLKNNFCLKIVLIGGNKIQTTGVNLIVQTAKNIATLQLLDISDNNVHEYKRNHFKKIFFANIIIIV